MTVKDLIAILSEMPQDAVVIYDLFSEHEKMETEDVELFLSVDKKMMLRPDGRYMEVRSEWLANNKDGEFVTVVNFPGN